MKKFRFMALAFLTLFVFSAFELGAADRKKIVVGVAPGPYADLFKLGIKPALEKKGYVVDFREFSDYVQPNLALSNKSVDVNIFQHSTYLAKFSED